MNNVDIVINYNTTSKQFNLYEPTSDTLLVSENLTEGLVLLNEFLMRTGLIDSDILKTESIRYQLDSATMKAMIDSNVKLIKKLNRAPSDFQVAKDRFGSTPLASSSNSKRFSQSSNGNKLKENISSSIDENSRSYRKDEGFSTFGKGFKKKTKF